MNDTIIIASDPKELAQAQHAMIQTTSNKLEAAISEAKDAKDMAESIVKSGMTLGLAQARRIHRRATSRVGYLAKVKQALEAGFVMMPDMPGEIVAVRTEREFPTSQAMTWRNGGAWQVPAVRAQGLPAGTGRYVAPEHVVDTRQITVNRKRMDGTTYQDTQDQARALELRDPDGIDKRFLRPEVMSRTAAALTMRVFDEIATVTPTTTSRGRRGNDPIILGRIVDTVSGKVAAFMIAHFIDPNDI